MELVSLALVKALERHVKDLGDRVYTVSWKEIEKDTRLADRYIKLIKEFSPEPSTDENAGDA